MGQVSCGQWKETNQTSLQDLDQLTPINTFSVCILALQLTDWLFPTKMQQTLIPKIYATKLSQEDRANFFDNAERRFYLLELVEMHNLVTPIISSSAVLPVYFSLGWLRETCIRQGLFPLWMVGAGTSPCLCLCCLWKGSGGPVWPAGLWIGPRDCGAVRKPWPCVGLNPPWGPTNSQASLCQTA